MTAQALAPRHRVATRPTAGAAVTRLAVRQLRRGTLLVTAVCGGMSALVAAQYQSTFEGELSQEALRTLAENPAIRILFGTPMALDDPGGFTVWRTGTPLLVLAGVWIMLAAIRVTRGEEDTRRWDLLLSGPLRAADALRRYLVTLAGSALVISAGVGLGLLAVGTDARGALLYAAGFLGVTLTFAAIGSAAGQIMPSRSSAVGVAVALLGTTLLIRMLADGAEALEWMMWLSPYGLIARVAPYAENRIAPLLVLACYAAIFVLLALTACRRRDVGSGLFTLSTHRPPRTWLLTSVGGFAGRRALRPTAGWAAGIGAYFLIVGAMIASILDFFDQNPRFAELASATGFAGLGTSEGFAAALFSLLAIPTGLYGATRLAAFVANEEARNWTMVFASPVRREHLVGTEMVWAAAGIAVLHTVAAAAMWAGAVLTGAPLSLLDAIAGALNTAPIAWISLGTAVLAVGWIPSMTAAIGAVPVVGGFLLNVIAQNVQAPDWVSELSPFVHVAPVPSTPPDWPAATALIVIGVALASCGVAGYRRRDLSS